MEIDINTKKRVLSSDLTDMYKTLTNTNKREIKNMYNKKFEKEKDSRLNRLLNETQSPTPAEDSYLTKVIEYYYAFENNQETMSFEQIQEL